ncbi:MAG: restriction endonuclease [Ardenticatenales bacterium]|nr:restriction endonuclease [Ardenticatenales bacterium]
MTIPGYQTIMLPLLKFAADDQEHSLREAIDALAETYQLTDDERKELLPSGQQATFDNRVGWARTYLKKAGLLIATRRGHFQISDRGHQVLAQKPTAINNAFLKQFAEFVAFQQPQKTKYEQNSEDSESEMHTPEEEIEAAYQRVRSGLVVELLQTIKSCSPAFFERLVIDLLLKMGYGGTRRDAGAAIGKSGDGGIDGIIKEDRLGLDIVYIQAKRWDNNNTVGRPEIQKFAGALQGQRARKGIFITTSDFTSSAREYTSIIDSKIVLIDGDTLAQLMIDFNIGVTSIASYELKRVDSDYFTEE